MSAGWKLASVVCRSQSQNGQTLEHGVDEGRERGRFSNDQNHSQDYDNYDNRQNPPTPFAEESK
jgi:hypothetical protein